MEFHAWNALDATPVSSHQIVLKNSDINVTCDDVDLQITFKGDNKTYIDSSTYKQCEAFKKALLNNENQLVEMTSENVFFQQITTNCDDTIEGEKVESGLFGIHIKGETSHFDLYYPNKYQPGYNLKAIPLF